MKDGELMKDGKPVVSAVLALGGGALWALCFARQGAVVLPWLALVPLISLQDRPGAFRWGWLHGAVHWAVAIPWIVPTLITFGGLPKAVAVVLFVLLTLYLGLYQGFFVWLGRSLWLRGGWVAMLGLPALWVAVEAFRGWFFFGGFPWNLAGYAWVALPGALPLTAWIGTHGLSFLLLFANVGLALAWRQRRFEPAVLAVLVPLLFCTLAGRFSVATDPVGSSHEVLLLQPDLPIVSESEAIQRNYAKLLGMSSAECSSPDEERRLLLWPESAAWPFAYDRDPRLQEDVARLVAGGCDVIANSPTFDGEEVFNSALLIEGSGASARYHKRHLVPWGEYVPLADVLPFVGKLARQAGSFSHGDDLGLLPWSGERIGMSICYEVTYPGAVVEQVRSGATVLATITNDAWYGDSWAPWQHFRAARFRAAENRRPLLRVALTGVSGAIDARGAVESRLGVGETGILRLRVAGYDELTPYSRAPFLVPVACVVLALLALLLSRCLRVSGRQAARLQ